MKTRIVTSLVTLSVICVLMLVFTSVGRTVNEKKVTENALSLIAMVLKDEKYENVKFEMTKNLLSFAELSEDCEKGILQFVKEGNSIDELIEKLEYFEYTGKNIVALEELVISDELEQAVKVIDKMTSEDLAKKLIKEVYYGVSFEEQIGKGYIKRFYCSNVCIDACEGGKIRYLCDVTAKSDEDLFLKWLYKNETVSIIEKTEKNGVIYESFEGGNIKGDLYINPENNRVIAAEIAIKYDE